MGTPPRDVATLRPGVQGRTQRTAGWGGLEPAEQVGQAGRAVQDGEGRTGQCRTTQRRLCRPGQYGAVRDGAGVTVQEETGQHCGTRLPPRGGSTTVPGGRLGAGLSASGGVVTVYGRGLRRGGRGLNAGGVAFSAKERSCGGGAELGRLGPIRVRLTVLENMAAVAAAAGTFARRMARSGASLTAGLSRVGVPVSPSPPLPVRAGPSPRTPPHDSPTEGRLMPPCPPTALSCPQ